MLDAYDRPMKPMGKVGKDVFRLIMVVTDTKTLLNASSKCMEIQSLVLDDSFWKAKFMYEFPETGLKEIPGWACEYQNLDLPNKFQSQPWRRLYNVMYHVIFALRAFYCKKMISAPSPNVRFVVTPIDIYMWKCITVVNGKSLKPISISFDDVMRKIAKSSNYLFECANSSECITYFTFRNCVDGVAMYLNTIKLNGISQRSVMPFSYYFTLGYIPDPVDVKTMNF